MPHFPFLVRDNHAAGRDVVLTADAAAEVVAAYGTAFRVLEDTPVPSLIDALDRLPPGTPYVVSLLTPPRDEHFDPAVFEEVLGALMPAVEAAPPAAYEVWAGLTGAPPAFHRSSDRPFRDSFSLLGDRFVVRMDAWLPYDTFRRGGFGRVIRGRDPLLTVERGASVLWFTEDGAPVVTYLGGLYAPEPRFRIPVGATLGIASVRPAAVPGWH